ncbi:hypothetical protein D3C76_1839990 [compost metagenome]
MPRRLIKIVLAYNRKIETITTSKTEAAVMAAPPLIELSSSSIEGSYCKVTKAKYKATLKTSANTYR